MVERFRQPVIPVRPPQHYSVTLTGKVVYSIGQWGTNIPVRTATVMTGGRDFKFPGIKHSTGDEAEADEYGDFSVTATTSRTPSGVSILDFLWIREVKTGRMHLHDLSHAVRSGYVNLQQSTPQSIGTVRMPWGPGIPLATLNGKNFVDYREFLKQLHQVTRSPIFPITISLFQEQGEFDEYSDAQDVFEQLRDNKLPNDFSSRLGAALAKSNGAGSSSNGSDPFAITLQSFSLIDIKKLEDGNQLTTLLNAIESALAPYPTIHVNEPPRDLAAAALIVLYASLMRSNSLKTQVDFRSFEMPKAPTTDVLEFNIGLKKLSFVFKETYRRIDITITN